MVGSIGTVAVVVVVTVSVDVVVAGSVLLWV
jgi:hypothetical protein